MKRSILLLLAMVISFFAFAQPYTIILGRPTDHAITASIMFSQNGQFFLTYGTQSGNYVSTTPTMNNTVNLPDEVEMTGLTPNTRYYYQLRYQPVGTTGFISSEEYSFMTQRAPGSTFTFTIEADEHLYDKKGVPNMYNVTLNNQLNDHPDFMISLGDIFGDDHSYLDQTYTITADELDYLHKYYLPFLGKVCHSIPFYIALGNHEGERKHHFNYPVPPPNNLPINGTLARKKYFPNPFPNAFYSGNNQSESYGINQPENYYAWTWGDGLFVVLDPYRYDSRSDTTPKPTGWDWTLGITQYLWLKQTLETSHAKYKFVFAHHIRGEGRGGITNAITNEWGGYQRSNGTTGDGYTFNTNRPASEGWTQPIHQLFIDNHVNIFFQGHDHVFAHEELDGIVYQSCPMAADSTYQIGMLANAAAYVSDTVDGTGHIRVTVAPECVKVDYVKAYLPADTISGVHHNREIGFSYTLGTCSTPPVIDSTYTDFVEVYPNPAQNNIHLNFHDQSTLHDVKLMNSLGQVVFNGQGTDIDVTSYPSGLYFLMIKTEKNQITKKILVHHP